LKPGGYFFAEDFYKHSHFTDEEKRVLRDEVSCPYCPDRNTYKAQLKNAGFEEITFTDLTDDWRQFTQQRVTAWDMNRENLLSVHREDTYNRLRSFYVQISDLFKGGNLGGCRIVARKPSK